MDRSPHLVGVHTLSCDIEGGVKMFRKKKEKVLEVQIDVGKYTIKFLKTDIRTSISLYEGENCVDGVLLSNKIWERFYKKLGRLEHR